MTELIPIFPLKLIAFPGEQLNLHIFEPRYKQLISDIEMGERRFGISIYLDRLMPIGTEMILEEVYKRYEDGRLDIKTKAMRIFELISFQNPMGDRQYAGGMVDFLPNDLKAPANLYNEFLFYLKEFFRLMNYRVELTPLKVNSYTFAHKIGLKQEEEYELLLLSTESDRLNYLVKYLVRIIPVMRDLEKVKKRIQMNGHFKRFDPLDF